MWFLNLNSSAVKTNLHVDIQTHLHYKHTFKLGSGYITNIVIIFISIKAFLIFDQNQFNTMSFTTFLSQIFKSRISFF